MFNNKLKLLKEQNKTFELETHRKTAINESLMILLKCCGANGIPKDGIFADKIKDLLKQL